MSNPESFFDSPAALQLISELSAKLSHTSELALISQYRKSGADKDLLSFALTQAKLRSRATAKFGELAENLLFTESALEQATRQQVANWHAGKFVAINIESITDLGAGIGSDAIGFAKAMLKVVAIENHPIAFRALSHNLSHLENASAIKADAQSHEVDTEALWLDPARREQDRQSLKSRRLDPDQFSPNLNFVFQIARRFPTGIKLAPGFPHELIPAGFESNWVSHAGDLVELVLWSEPIGKPNLKKAVLLTDSTHEFEGEQTPARIGELGEFVYEPDASLIRSHLIGDFANQNGLSLISENIAYLSAATLISSPWLKAYRVKELLPLDEKKIRAYCTQNQIGILEIKKRGVDVTPESMRPKLKLKGAGVATLILTKVGNARQAIVCEPIR